MQKSKKILIGIIVGLLSVILVLVLTLAILDWIEKSKPYEEEVISYEFYEPDFEENIYKDEEYQAMIQGGLMRYCDASLGVTYGIQRGNTDTYGKDVSFMVELVYAAIEGDHKAYNACFSDAYYDSGRSPKEAFTMQKIYNVLIERTAVETVSDKNGNYTKYSYSLTYQIYENNGTFRKDIGDGSKTQYIVLTDRTGQLLIDSVATIRGKGTSK